MMFVTELREDIGSLRGDLDRKMEETVQLKKVATVSADTEAKVSAALTALTQKHGKLEVLCANLEKERDHYLAELDDKHTEASLMEDKYARQDTKTAAELEELYKLRALTAVSDTDINTLQQQLATAQSVSRQMEHENATLRGEVARLQPRSLDLQTKKTN